MKFHLPDLGEGIVEAELVEWHVHPGDEVQRGQTLLEIMTDKAVVDVPAPFEGVVQDLLAQAGEIVHVGEALLTYVAATQEAEGKSTSAETSEVPPSSTREADRKRELRIPAAPTVRRQAREAGVELHTVKPSGPGGRVLLRDLEAVVEQRDRKDDGQKIGARAARAKTHVPGSRVRLHGLRRAIAETMTHSVQTIPQYSLIDECDATALVTTRDALKETCNGAAVKLTYLAFMVRAVVEALKESPLLNASLDEAAEEIILHDDYHIGIATATPEGLIVSVIHDADERDIVDIAREIERLADAARRGKIRPADLRGGTFTITSIGNIGGLISTPIIRPPEVAIMGAGKIVRRPMYNEHGQLRPADLLYLSFTFDHRVVDGDVGAHFARAVIHRLENPASLLVSI